MKALLIAFDPSELEPLARFGVALGAPFDVLLLTGSADEGYGASEIFQAGLATVPPADGLAKGIASVAGDYTHVAAAASMRSKDVMPRVAVLLDAGMVTDAIAALDGKTYQRPIVAGSVIATVTVETERVVLTVRTSAFGPATPTGSAHTRFVTLDCPSAVARTSAETQASGGRPDLTQAKVVVSGGRPLKDAATFEKLIGGLADALGGGVGATRAAVDSGIAPNEAQVGQTGKIVAPELYIAAGVSGSTQHLAGMKDSKCIVAINTDGDAPIFEVADFGLVEDLYTAIPALMERLRQ